MPYCEMNLDGLIGPTHNYAGLSFGNLASLQNRQSKSNPRQAALQGLAKMKWMMDRGVVQAVMPPQVRPNFRALHDIGFSGTPENILQQAWQQAADLFSMCCSASSMWAANAATIAPSCDTDIKKLCITPANLVSHFHRSLEVPFTASFFNYVFSDERFFQVNSPLPAVAAFSDEGAANHMRLRWSDQQAVHVFVYGGNGDIASTKYPARQALNASRSVQRLNCLSDDKSVYVRQNSQAIDQGVFHNDVIALSHNQWLLCHEHAFVNQPAFLQHLKAISDNKIQVITANDTEISLDDAVKSYLFNSQIVTIDDGQYAMLLPFECEQKNIKNFVEGQLRSEMNLKEIHYMDLKQSMRNGGGPACLRLRIPITPDEIQMLKGNIILNDKSHKELKAVIENKYPEVFEIKDLADMSFCRHLYEINESICSILELPVSLLNPYLP